MSDVSTKVSTVVFIVFFTLVVFLFCHWSLRRRRKRLAEHARMMLELQQREGAIYLISGNRTYVMAMNNRPNGQQHQINQGVMESPANDLPPTYEDAIKIPANFEDDGQLFGVASQSSSANPGENLREPSELQGECPATNPHGDNRQRPPSDVLQV